MATKKATVPVSERALIQRINRALREDDRVLKATRGERARLDLGYFYILDTRRNFVVAKECNLEVIGRELGVLADYEHWDEEN
jgi:hypothetical protein